MAKKIIFIIFIIFGIALRIYDIQKVPGGLFADEVSIGVNAKTIAQNGVDEFGRKYPFAFESFSDYKMPGYIYATALAYKVLGSQILTVRFAAMLSGIISIFLIGYLAFLLFPYKKDIALYAMLVLALSPYHIHFSRIAYETMMATMFLLLYLISFIQVRNGRRKVLWFVVAVISILVSCWTYPAPRLIIPLVTTTIFFYDFFIKLQKKDSVVLRWYMGFFLVIVISFLPTFLIPALDKRTLSYVFGGDIGKRILESFASYLRGFQLEFLFDKGDIFALRHGTGVYGVFLSVFIIPFMIGLGYIVRFFSIKNFSFFFLGLLLIVAGLPSAITWFVPYGPRFLPMVIPLALLVALGIVAIIAWTSGKKKLQFFIFLLFVGTLFFQTFDYTRYYFLYFPRFDSAEFSLGPVQMTSFLRDHLTASTTLYFLEGKSCYPWIHDDLQLWYFLPLNNQHMIQWNTYYKNARYATGDPFNAYDKVDIPSYSFENVNLYPTVQQIDAAPKGSLIVHCGIHLPDINQNKEKILQIFYLNTIDHRDPLYIVTQKS